MLRLLQSLFGREEVGRVSEALLKEAIERAVDGTDPWLRAVSGYRKKLKPAVEHAVEHVMALVDSLSPPVPVTSESYDDPKLKPFFISAEEMRTVFSQDRALHDFLAAGGTPRPCALLAMEKRERRAFGAELAGNVVLHDVPQVTVTFENHRLLDPAAEEGETRRLLMRRAYDHLLGLALKRLTGIKGERSGLEKRRDLLNAKLNLLQEGGFGFGQGGGRGTVAELEERLREIEAQLAELGGEDRIFDSYLGVVVNVLRQAEEHLWWTRETISIDRMGIKRDPGSVPPLTFAELRNTEGRNMVALLVSLRVDDFPNIER